MNNQSVIEVTVEEETTQQNNMIAMLERVATNPDVDVSKLEKMLEMQERIMAKQAEIDFNQAMSRLQPKIPQIKKDARAHNSDYARYETIEKAVRPLYTAEGFSVSFNSKSDGGETTYYGTLSHASGHSRTAEITLPDDKGGSKNGLQARASSSSYAKRYLLCMLMNIVTTDEDDDAQSAQVKTLTEEQSIRLQEMMDYDSKRIAAFKKHYGIEVVDDLPAHLYGKAEAAIRASNAKREQQ